MGKHNLYSKRNNPLPDIYTYNEIPEKLRIQIEYIVEDFINKNQLSPEMSDGFWKLVGDVLRREHGKRELSSARTNRGEVRFYLAIEKETERVLDIIEICFQTISKIPERDSAYRFIRYNYYPIDEAIEDLNTRFKENGIGYKFESGIIIKFDNEILHSSIIKPALLFLTDPAFKPVNDEFLKAHEHFRHGRLKESIIECGKTFESTMKIICHRKQWLYSQNDTASKLIKILYDNNFIPSYLQTQIGGLRSTLETGIPVVRNKTSAHGQGVAAITVDEALASYTLNLAGSTIKFLFELMEN